MKKRWYVPLAHFASHTIQGTLMFMVIGIPAVCLGLLTHWLKSIGVAQFTYNVLSFLEHTILIIDSTIFLVYLLHNCFYFLKEILKEEV